MRRREIRPAPAAGPYCEMQQLLALRAAATLLRLQPPRRARADAAGGIASLRRGRGIEFEEVRAYAAGDDVRAIDWRVTARTGKPHTRLFREERERPVFVLVDQRQGMFFGSRRTLKSVQAVHAAALLAWAALAGGDRIGGLVLGNEGHHEVRPRRDRHAALALLGLCRDANHRLAPAPVPAGAGGALADALASTRRVARPGTAVVLLSDFAGWNEAAAQQLQLLARHATIVAIQVFDPLEAALPAQGRATVSDGSRRVPLDGADRALQARHRAHFLAERAAVTQSLARIGAPLLTLATDQDALEVLARCFRGGAL